MGGKAADPNKAARKAQADKMKRLELIDAPDLEEYVLQNPELIGLLEDEQLGQSSLEDIQLDPAMKDKQMMALQGLQDRAESGMTQMDKLQMEDMLGQAAAQEKSQRAGIESEMARRGMQDSGAALMAKLQGSQGGANAARQKAMQMAAQSQQQKMSALQGMGQMAGQMEGADYQRQAQAASAKDAIAKANAMNRQNVNAMNLSARQQHENSRANIANQQSQVGNQINQQNFNNQMAKAGSQNSISAGPVAPQGPSAAQQIMTIGGGVVGGIYGGPAGAAAGAQAGSAVGGAFEDGGIAHKSAMAEEKAHDKFKRDYMKRVRGELVPQEQARKEVTGVVHAEDGFSGQRSFGDVFKKRRAALGPGASFDWQGKEYSTDLADETAPQTLAQEKQPDMPNMFNADQANADIEKSIETGEAQGGVEQIAGITNDKINEQDTTPVPQKEDMSGEDVMGGIGAIGSIAKTLNPEQEAPAEFQDTFKLEQAENIMSPVQAQEFGNAFAGAQFEDGGISPLSEMARMKLPNYECGGIHSGTQKAENGDIMFDSEGDGAVVGGESFERDRVDARLNSGEAVLNVAQQQRLMDILRGEESVDSLGEDDIVEGVPESYQDELTDEIDGGEGSDLKVKGLQKLLSALGEE